MSIVITGDTHGTFDIGKVVRYFNEHEDEYTQDDYLIICGDVGICGFSAAYEANTRAVFRSLPVTTLFIDGNHENFEQLNSYAVEQWNGGKVHIIEDNMIHLMRGQIFKIDGLKFFTFGGAYSIDKMSRAEGISWFPEEIPSREEYEEGWKNLEKEDFQVDYILTHTAPRDVPRQWGMESCLTMRWNSASTCSAWRMRQSFRNGISDTFMKMRKWKRCLCVCMMRLWS